MSVKEIYARKKYLEMFDAYTEGREAKFLALYGRRRIGKTYFIENYFTENENASLLFHVTGSKGSGMVSQLIHFMDEVREVFFETYQEVSQIVGPADSWLQAFRYLRMSLDRYYLKVPYPEKKVVVFIDEIPWFVTQRSHFIASLEHFWNRYARKYNNFILVVCGSAATWMINHIINETGGLYNRIDHQIKMSPFDLFETRTYLKDKKGIELTPLTLVELYLAIGGIVKYLDFVEHGQSPAQFIGTQIIRKSGNLHYEFEKLFLSLFNNYKRHLNVIRVLSKPRSSFEEKQGMTTAEIVARIPSESPGGSFQEILQELEASDFISSMDIDRGDRTTVMYRLQDEFSLFYQNFLSSVQQRRSLKTSDDWLKMRSTMKWSSWSGFAFEALCFHHLRFIQHALQIAGISSTFYSFLRRGTQDRPGCQIDLVIDRKDNVGNLVEMKFSTDKFTISKAYADELRMKKEIWEKKTGKTAFITFLTSHGVHKNAYYNEWVHKDLTIDIFFREIPFE